MRLTIDIDDKNYIELIWKIIKGIYVTHKLPEIKESSGGRGFHLIWYRINMNEDEINEARIFIGDDSNRVRLDMCSDARVPQILFDKKEVRYNNKKD